jgi:hypothetical protein
LLLIFTMAVPVFAQSVTPTDSPGGVQDFFSAIVTQTFLNQLLSLLGLILLQVVLAVALAVKTRVFEWNKLGDFYLTLVLPYVMGWIVFIVAAQLISTELLPAEFQLVGDGVTWAAWSVVVASLGDRIIKTIKDLYGSLPVLPTSEIK